MSEAQKDTVYVDVDDEITTIIDKVKNSQHKIVALVLPKRATVLQSIVNMKLLKRSADASKKKLVLITSENGLMPLAGAVGLHVAKNLQSKPVIPEGPDTGDIPESLVHEEEIEPTSEVPLDTKKSVGELAGQEDNSLPPEDETILVDNGAPSKKPVDSKAKKAAAGKDKNLKVPNFERFRKWIIIGGVALVVLLVGGWLAFFQLPKAHIVIDAESSDKLTTVTFTANTASAQFDPSTNTVPAQRVEAKKTDTQTAPATGQQNIGNKASGQIRMVARLCSGPITPPPAVPAGTGVSANGQTYITQSAATFGSPDLVNGCVEYETDQISIVAQNPGIGANTGNTNFSVSGRGNVTGRGNASGGTDNIVKVVNQNDVDAARQKINTGANEQSARDELTAKLEQASLIPVPESFATHGPEVTTSPNVGAQADTVTVNAVTTYTMIGVNKNDLSQIVTAQAEKDINRDQQAVINDGLSNARFTVLQNDTNPRISVQSSVVIGPKIDMDALKQEVAGKKKGETIQIIESRPDIREVTVNYSPFWVTKTPSKPSKITIVFNEAASNN